MAFRHRNAMAGLLASAADGSRGAHKINRSIDLVL